MLSPRDDRRSRPSRVGRDNLNQANKLSRTYASLVESLNRHRGKGQQKVTVEHVHVHEGGQAIVGNVESPGGGFTSKSKEQPHAKQITHAPGQTMPSADTPREPVPITRDEERPMPDARRTVDRAHRREIRTPSSTGATRQKQLHGGGRLPSSSVLQGTCSTLLRPSRPTMRFIPFKRCVPWIHKGHYMRPTHRQDR